MTDQELDSMEKSLRLIRIQSAMIAILAILLIVTSVALLLRVQDLKRIKQDYINIATNAQFQAPPAPPANLK